MQHRCRYITHVSLSLESLLQVLKAWQLASSLSNAMTLALTPGHSPGYHNNHNIGPERRLLRSQSNIAGESVNCIFPQLAAKAHDIMVMNSLDFVRSGLTSENLDLYGTRHI